MAHEMTDAAKEFPFTDEAGTIWVDPSGIEDKEEHPCFLCGEMTNRVDVDFSAHYCDSNECNTMIDRLLKIDLDSLAFENKGDDFNGNDGT